ncbi:MAG: hypothetical protein ACK4N1_10460 [Pseudorhizobium sp.]
MRIFSFIQVRPDSRSGISLDASGTRSLLGLPVLDVGWPEIFAKAEAALQGRTARTEITFLDDATLAAALMDRDYRSWISDQLLLTSRRGLSGLLAVLMRRRPMIGFSAETLVPALLTYADRPLKVLLIGESGHDGQQLQARLKDHAPWHLVGSVAIDRLQPMPAIDLVIVTKPRLSATERIRLSGVSAGLVVFAGKGLRRLAESNDPVGDRSAIFPASRAVASKAA